MKKLNADFIEVLQLNLIKLGYMMVMGPAGYLVIGDIPPGPVRVLCVVPRILGFSQIEQFGILQQFNT